MNEKELLVANRILDELAKVGPMTGVDAHTLLSQYKTLLEAFVLRVTGEREVA